MKKNYQWLILVKYGKTITKNGEIYFMDKQVDLGNRHSWCGPVDLYMQMETILYSYNYRLKNIESYGSMFFDYFR